MSSVLAVRPCDRLKPISATNNDGTARAYCAGMHWCADNVFFHMIQKPPAALNSCASLAMIIIHANVHCVENE